MLKDTRYIRAYPKVGPENRDFWCDARSETQDQSHRWDLKPRILKVGPETRDPTHRWDPGPENRDLESEFLANFLSFLYGRFEIELSTKSFVWIFKY